MGAVAADFGSGQEDLEAQTLFDLAANLLQGFAEEFFHFATAQADDMGMFLLETGFIIMLVAAVVHQVEFVHESTFLEHFQGTVDGDAVEFGVLCLGELEECFGVEVLAGFVDEG